MTAEDAEHGWWDMPALPAWKCPECGDTSPTRDWVETEVSCGECDHDARVCPACGEAFDHVWGAAKIAAASRGPS